MVTTAHAGSLPAEHSFASVSPENVVLTAVKKAEDANGLIFRIYEWAGKDATAEFHVPPGATAATVTNMMETPEGARWTVRRRGQGADSPLRDPDHPRRLSGTCGATAKIGRRRVKSKGASATEPFFVTLTKRIEHMSITSPFVVVPVIIVIFALAIRFATSSKEDGHSSH